MGFLDSLTNITPAEVSTATPPATNVVDWFHKRASTNRDTDLHHPLGNDPGEAAYGDHSHDGKRGVALWPADDVPPALLGSATLAQTITRVNDLTELLRRKSA